MQVPRDVSLHRVESSCPHLPQPIPPILLRHPEVVHGPAVQRHVLVIQSEVGLIHGEAPGYTTPGVVLVQRRQSHILSFYR